MIGKITQLGSCSDGGFGSWTGIGLGRLAWALEASMALDLDAGLT